jgi:ParB/RepB/Spo0J family partition protein
MKKEMSYHSFADLGESRVDFPAKQFKTVAVVDVISKPQVRKEFNGIEELASSLLIEGQQTPIIVSPPNKDGKYVIQKGERRWRACKFAKIPFIDVIVNNKFQNEIDQTAGELIENIQREDLTALEIANALEKFIESGWKQIEIANRLGKSQKFISSYLGLNKLPDCVITLYENKVCLDIDSLNMLRKIYEIDPERCKQICKEASRKGIDRNRCRELLNKSEKSLINKSIASINLPGSTFTSAAVLSEKFHTISPESLTVEVLLRVGRRRTIGILLLDRFSKSGELAWVKVKSADSDVIYPIKASRLQILRVKKSEC